MLPAMRWRIQAASFAACLAIICFCKLQPVTSDALRDDATTLSNGTFDGDVNVLQELLTAFNDKNLDATGDPCVPTPWPWVGCDNDTTPARIVKLLLFSANLNGATIPSSVINLTELTVMNFSKSNVGGPLPDLSPLSNLQILTFESNNIGGYFPTWLTQLKNLTYLNLSRNGFNGSIPDTLFSSLTKLQTLYLDYNNLSGPIPDNLGALQQLQLFRKLTNNSFEGPVPSSLGQLINLQELWLDDNPLLSGPLPNLSNLTSLTLLYIFSCGSLNGSMPSLSNLTHLSDALLWGNQFSGPIPDLTNLPNLTQLWLKNNNLTGPLPDLISGQLPRITDFEVQNNILSGPIPASYATLDTLQTLSLQNNRFTSIPQALLSKENLNLKYDAYLTSGKAKHKQNVVVIVVPILVGLSLGTLIILLGCFIVKKKCRKQPSQYESVKDEPPTRPTGAREGVRESELANLERGPRKFTYQELITATKGFDPKGVLGKGGFGQVYKGFIQDIGTEVAVKRISKTSNQGVREFMTEVKTIGQVSHRNMVQLLGWCYEAEELMLVYELMPNGSLDRALFGRAEDGPSRSVLTWKQRYEIVRGVARALLFLHEEWVHMVVHRDVKASNVMLDSNFNARLGDFGLARVYDHSNKLPDSTFVAGTWGYLAPECTPMFKGRVTDKTDVYSFGALTLEIVCGRKVLVLGAPSMEYMLQDWVWALYKDDKILDALDPRLRTSEERAFDESQMIMVLQVGLLCSHPNPDARPHMRQVLSILAGHSAVPEIPREKPVPVFASLLKDDLLHNQSNPGPSPSTRPTADSEIQGRMPGTMLHSQSSSDDQQPEITLEVTPSQSNEWRSEGIPLKWDSVPNYRAHSFPTTHVRHSKAHFLFKHHGRSGSGFHWLS